MMGIRNMLYLMEHHGAAVQIDKIRNIAMLQYDRVWSSPLICNDETGLTVVAERKFEAAGVAFTVDQCVADQGIVYNSLLNTSVG